MPSSSCSPAQGSGTSVPPPRAAPCRMAGGAGRSGQLLAARPELAPLFDKARPRLADLVRNPFNLNLAAGLFSGNPDLADKVGSQLDLLKLYWDERVATGTEVYAARGPGEAGPGDDQAAA